MLRRCTHWTFPDVSPLHLILYVNYIVDIVDESRPSINALWRDHLTITAILQILEHAPFFTSLQSLAYLPGAILYAYVHAMVVMLAVLSLHIVRLTIKPPAKVNT